MRRTRVLIVDNRLPYLIINRLPLATRLHEAGWDVHTTALTGRGRRPSAPSASRSTSSYLENPLAAHTLLMKRMKCGVQAVIYVDDPAWETFTLINEIHRLLGMKRPAWTVPLGLARPIARASVSNEEALATTVEWHVRERWGAKAAATELP